MHFKLEKGVEMPDKVRLNGVSKNQDLIDLLLAMEVEDSFTVPMLRKQSLQSVMYGLIKNGKAKKKRWSIRKEDNVTARIWRIK